MSQATPYNTTDVTVCDLQTVVFTVLNDAIRKFNGGGIVCYFYRIISCNSESSGTIGRRK